jgi:membrane-associated protein
LDFGFLVDLFLHLDKHLGAFMQQYGTSVYVALFLIIFCETGLVVTPFLPGDSLIFASGALAATGIMGWGALLLFMTAAVTGNMLNYQIGRFLSEKIKQRQQMRFIKQENLDRTQEFFDRHGGITIVITRFMPILRTFSPFVAGVGKMPYRRFLFYNTVGGVSWASVFFLIGYFFGNLPAVQSHFSVIVIAIIVISVIPAFIAYFKNRAAGKKARNAKKMSNGASPFSRDVRPDGSAVSADFLHEEDKQNYPRRSNQQAGQNITRIVHAKVDPADADESDQQGQ